MIDIQFFIYFYKQFIIYSVNITILRFAKTKIIIGRAESIENYAVRVNLENDSSGGVIFSERDLYTNIVNDYDFSDYGDEYFDKIVEADFREVFNCLAPSDPNNKIHRQLQCISH